jgi:hypothetical protein
MQLCTKYVWNSTICTLFLIAVFNIYLAFAQQADPNQLAIKTTSLPRAYPHQLYRLQLENQGGVPPFTWNITGGALPTGMALGTDGVISGVPNSTGEFHFVVTITDSGRPAQKRKKELTLQVVAPLSIAWGQPPKINGQRIEGTIKVTNQTETTFDLTAVVLAVNEIGRATAIGYQRFPLKPNNPDFEIPFGENLPPGAYEINADVVAEVAEINAIYRARLVTPEKLQMRQGP